MAVPLILKRVATGIGIRKLISKDTKPIPKSEIERVKKGLNDIPKGIKIEVKTNEKQIRRKINRFEDVLHRSIDKGLKQAGFQLLDIIRTKTQKGIDFRDKPFAPYSQGYLKQLQREGKPLKVDLFNTGRMLGSLTPSSKTIKKTGKGKITLSFSNAEMMQRALFNQVLNEPKREFFGFNNRTEKIINKQFNRFIDKELRKARI